MNGLCQYRVARFELAILFAASGPSGFRKQTFHVDPNNEQLCMHSIKYNKLT